MTAIAIKPSQRPFSEIGKFFRKFINSPEIVKVSAGKSLGLKTKQLVNDLEKIRSAGKDLGALIPFFETIAAFEAGLNPRERKLLSQRLQRFLAITVQGKWNTAPSGKPITAEHIYVQDPNGVPTEVTGIQPRSIHDLMNDTSNIEYEYPIELGSPRLKPKDFYFEALAKPFMHDKLQFIQKIYLDEFTAVERHS